MGHVSMAHERHESMGSCVRCTYGNALDREVGGWIQLFQSCLIILVCVSVWRSAEVRVKLKIYCQHTNLSPGVLYIGIDEERVAEIEGGSNKSC